MCSSVETFWLLLAPSGITKLIPMALWGLMKQNDQSVQEIHIFIFHILVPHDFFTLSASYIVTPVSQFIINSFTNSLKSNNLRSDWLHSNMHTYLLNSRQKNIYVKG